MTSHIPENVLFESFTYPFFDFRYDVNHKQIVNSFLSMPDSNPLRGGRGLYIHIPFCDTICNFCPFVKSVGTESRIQQYLDALIKEIKLISKTKLAISWKIDSIYIGGGTPTILNVEQFENLISNIKKSFNLTDDIEISCEVEVKSCSEEKLDCLSSLGVTRISFGAQTMDNQLKKMVNLTSTNEQIYNVINKSLPLFKDVNVDFIVGFPGQSISHAKKDIELATQIGATSISLYPLDYITVLPKFLNRIREGSLPQPLPVADRRTMFHECREVLSNSYSEQNMYCFGVEGLDPCRYMFSTLYGGYHDQYLGLGCGAYSYIRGLVYHNSMTEKEYINIMQNNSLPVVRSSMAQAYEKDLVYLPKRLKGSLVDAHELGIYDLVKPVIDEMETRNFIKLDGSSIFLTEKGKLEYDRLMISFLSDNQRRLYNGACKRLSEDLGLDQFGNLLAENSKIRGMGTKISLNLGKK